MVHEEKEESQLKEETSEKKENSPNEYPVTKKIRENPWILSTIVLAILSIILLAATINYGGNNQITKETASENIIDLFESQGMQGIMLESIEVSEKDNYFYKADLTYRDQTVPFYITKSGYLAGSALVSIIPNEDGVYELPSIEESNVETVPNDDSGMNNESQPYSSP